MSKASRRRGGALARGRSNATRTGYFDRQVGATRRWGVIGAIVVAVLGIGMAGFATTQYTDDHVPTTSDLSGAEIIDAANAVREQLEAAARVLAAEGQSVDRATAAARAEARLETMEERYWQALEGMRPGIHPDLETLIERIPRRAPEAPAESRDALISELRVFAPDLQ